MRIAIARRLLDQILRQAASSSDREICGLLLGDGAEIRTVLPAANVAVDSSRSFEVDPGLLFTVMKAERAGGPKIIGHYHSHPNGNAAPSRRDAEAAAPGLLWMIVAEGAATLWMAEVEGRFRPVGLDIPPG